MPIASRLPTVAAALLTGCASYSSLPLPLAGPLASSLAGLHGGVGVPVPLQVGDMARLAMENSPDLRATRAQRGVAQAQLLQAGLSPNPSVTGSILPLAAGLGDTTAWVETSVPVRPAGPRSVSRMDMRWAMAEQAVGSDELTCHFHTGEAW